MLPLFYNPRKSQNHSQSLTKEIEHLLNDTAHDLLDSLEDALIPSDIKADLTESDNAYVVRLEMPGVASDQFNVTTKENVLTISGNKNYTATGKTLRQESFNGKFTRSFTLSRKANMESIKAELKDGVLTLTIEKHPETQPKTISVSVAV